MVFITEYTLDGQRYQGPMIQAESLAAAEAQAKILNVLDQRTYVVLGELVGVLPSSPITDQNPTQVFGLEDYEQYLIPPGAIVLPDQNIDGIS